KVVPSEVVVDKDDEMLMLVFNEALGVGDEEQEEQKEEEDEDDKEVEEEKHGDANVRV
nr:hypothetical protein [Tanacetum cinerariifolium]